MPHWSSYTGRWWMGYLVRTARGLDGGSVAIIVLLYNGPLLCGCNVPIKGLNTAYYRPTPVCVNASECVVLKTSASAMCMCLDINPNACLLPPVQKKIKLHWRDVTQS